MKTNTQPAYWGTTKQGFPPYHSAEGWEFEKSRTLEVLKLQIRFARINRLLNKAELMFKAAYHAKDTRNLLRYEAITTILYRWHMSVAERLIFDYKQVL